MEREDLHRRETQGRDELVGKGSLVHEDSGLDLPEDIWCHICSLMPMRDAAQAACVSRAFLRSWKCRPSLTFGMETLGMNESACGHDEIAINFSSKVDHILKNHKCIGVKSLKIVFYSYNATKACNVDSWLQTAITPGIEELTVQLSAEWETSYNFPWSLLANGSGNSIRSLTLASCAFSPTVGLGLKSMTRLDLRDVRITEDQLECLLHNSLALQWMKLSHCNELSCLKMVNTPMLPSKFLHLKYLSIDLGTVTFSLSYDYCSLISFLDASPSLETFMLNVFQMKMEHESIVGGPSHLRKMPGHRHDNLKTVKIIGFSSAKSLVELTCHIIENTTSLDYLTLDTTRGNPFASCSSNKTGKCLLMCMDLLVEARKGLLAIRTYVEPKVPSRVKLTVVEPCRRCHDPEL